jgi:diguanylate cyclase (GGDEF)-like protein
VDVALDRTVLDSLSAQLAVVDHAGTVVLVNKEWRQLAEQSSCTSCTEGANFFDVCGRAHGPASADAKVAAEGLREVLAGFSDRFAMDLHCETPHGTRWYTLLVVPLVDRAAGAVLSYADITERKRLEALSEHRATHDVLTGLPNRSLIHDRLAQEIAAGARKGTAVAVLFVDVDRFKRVNDLFGHATGDAVLVEVGRRLTQCVRPSDTVGRLAGDEFIIICSASPAEQAAREIAHRVRDVMASPLHVAGHHLSVSVSVGIHVADRWEGSPQDLLHLADTAMFRAKSRGGGQVALHADAPPPDLSAAEGPGPRGVAPAAAPQSDKDNSYAGSVQRLLHLLRVTAGMDTAWVSEFLGSEQVFRFVDVEPGVTGPVPGTRLPLSGAYCARVINGTMPSLISDAHADPDGALLPVTFELHIGAYLGVPLHGPDGAPTGMLCATSSRPRPELTEEDLRSARLIADVLDDQHRRAMTAAAGQRMRSDLRDTVLRFCRGQGRSMVLQPVVGLSTRQTVAVEALTRFDRPERDPAQWFGAAASIGLGRPLELAAAQAALTCDTARSVPAVSVNLSPDVILDGGLDELLADHDPARVIVEMTQHAPVSSYEDLELSLGKHREKGLRLAVDDVGADYASLTHVLRLRPDVLKVDMSLIRGIDTDPVRQSLVAAMESLGQRLNATVVAEGVETDAELQTLLGLDVDQGQGYLFGRPSPVWQ